MVGMQLSVQMDVIWLPHYPYMYTGKRVLVGDRVGKGLTRSNINPILPSLLQFKGTIKYRPQGSDTPTARAEQHQWFRPGWTYAHTDSV